MLSLLLVAGTAQAAGEPLESPQQLAGLQGHRQSGIQLVRAASGGYAVLWYDSASDSPTSGYYVRAYAANGAPRGPAVSVESVLENKSTADIRLVMDGSGRFLVAWQAVGAIAGRHFAEDGTPMGPSKRLATTTLGLLRENWDLAMAPDGRYALMLVRETPTATGVTSLTLHRFDADGRARLLQPVAIRPDIWTMPLGGLGLPRVEYLRVDMSNRIAMDAQGNIVLASIIATESEYTPGTAVLRSGAPKANNRAVIQLRRIGAGGLPVGGVVTVATHESTDWVDSGFYRDPQLARASDGRVAIAWLHPHQGLMLRLYSADLATASPVRLVSALASRDSSFHLATSDAGKTVVTWAEPRLPSEPYGDLTARARLYDAAGLPLSGAINPHATNSGSQSEAQVGMDGQGNFVLGWQALGSRWTGGLESFVYSRRYSGL